MRVVVIGVLVEQQVLEMLSGWSGASMLQIQPRNALNSSLCDATDLSPEMK